jgi:LysM repeat protein
MRLILAFFPLAAAPIFLAPAAHAKGGDMAAEYAQVHKIALRDARVREAYDRANERLDARIIEIDPTLASYVHAHPSDREVSPAPETHAGPAPAAEKPKPKPFVAKRAASAPKPAAPAPTVAGKQKHVVAAGETLSGIAGKYHTTVEAIQAANRIPDVRKLQTGQMLVIP